MNKRKKQSGHTRLVFQFCFKMVVKVTKGQIYNGTTLKNTCHQSIICVKSYDIGNFGGCAIIQISPCTIY